jgi:hypothetical protein
MAVSVATRSRQRHALSTSLPSACHDPILWAGSIVGKGQALCKRADPAGEGLNRPPRRIGSCSEVAR